MHTVNTLFYFVRPWNFSIGLLTSFFHFFPEKKKTTIVGAFLKGGKRERSGLGKCMAAVFDLGDLTVFVPGWTEL